jgi:hypothetical protein
MSTNEGVRQNCEKVTPVPRLDYRDNMANNHATPSQGVISLLLDKNPDTESKNGNMNFSCAMERWIRDAS